MPSGLLLVFFFVVVVVVVFCSSFFCQLFVIDINFMLIFFFASYFHEKVVSILCYQDAGYGEKSLFSCDDDNDDSESKNIDDEVMTIHLF